MFFEGSEKKVEIVFNRSDLRRLGRDFWTKIIKECNATILSEMNGEKLDAYLLSESSLFVWDDYCLLITCGNTLLVNSIVKLVEEFGADSIRSLLFQRKNEYFGHLQKSCFEDDARKLINLFGGKVKAFQLGHQDGHHNYLLHLEKPYNPPASDRTCELLMYHVRSDVAEFFRTTNHSAREIRNYLKIEKMLEGWSIDDYAFKPFGYSLNAIKKDKYVTMHITPQEGSSYVSFETNLDTEHDALALVETFLENLCPDSFDIITFNHSLTPGYTKDYSLVFSAKEKLVCGYDIYFKHYIMPQIKAMGAKPLQFL